MDNIQWYVLMREETYVKYLLPLEWLIHKGWPWWIAKYIPERFCPSREKMMSDLGVMKETELIEGVLYD